MARPAAVSSVSAAVFVPSREGNTCPLSIGTEVETEKPATALAPLAAPSMRLLCVCPGCCLQVGTSVLVWAGVAVGWLTCSLLPSVLPLYVWSGKRLCGRAGCRSLVPVPHCMFSAGRCVFWCPLAGAESDFCGRNGRWKGLIFRHNRVFFQNQGAVLKKSSRRGVHPGDSPSRQGENERRPISCVDFSWIKRSTLLCRKMTRVHPVVSFPRNITLLSVDSSVVQLVHVGGKIIAYTVACEPRIYFKYTVVTSVHVLNVLSTSYMYSTTIVHATSCMYVCMVITYSRVWINRVRLPILLVVS